MAEIVLITGCATGIGRALALDMHSRKLENGDAAFTVYATDYRLQAVEDLGHKGLQTAQLDVSDVQSVNATIASILKVEGHIDLLVCNAGIALPGWLSEIDYAQVERIFNVNVHGVFRCVQVRSMINFHEIVGVSENAVMQAVAPSMIQRQRGKIAVMASVNSYFVSPFNGSYSGTKAAVLNMAEILAQELSPFGINVTTVIPGWVKSDIINTQSERFDRFERPESFFQHTIEAIKERRKAGIQLGCSPQKAAEDIANGLSRPKPPRFLYTGTVLLYALFWGFVQQWIRPQFLADALVQRCNLPLAAKLAPREWKGPYQEHSKARVAAPEE